MREYLVCGSYQIKPGDPYQVAVVRVEADRSELAEWKLRNLLQRKGYKVGHFQAVSNVNQVSTLEEFDKVFRSAV